jgi:DNA-binding FadR family transcriptional regulator
VSEDPSSKRGAVTADRIVRDITRSRAPVGTMVGSEAQLIARYGASRPVVREAIRLLEHRGVASMRRGPYGGLVVTEPTLDAVVVALAIQLVYRRITLGDVLEARRALEDATLAAPASLDPDAKRDALEQLAAGAASSPPDSRPLHDAVADLAANPALAILIRVLNRLVALYPRPPLAPLPRAAADQLRQGLVSIAASASSGALKPAHRALVAYLSDEASALRTTGPSGGFLDAGAPHMVRTAAKGGERLGHALVAEIAALGWPVGISIGSEQELRDRYAGSRTALREAVRVLEHYRIAEMRRGPRGGLIVGVPSLEVAAETLGALLERTTMEPEHLLQVRSALELEAIDLLDRQLDDESASLIASAASRRAGRVDLHAVLAELSGNPALGLLVRLLAATPTGAGPRSGRRAPGCGSLADHEQIVAAILGRDLRTAKRRMAAHLAPAEPPGR